MGKEIREIQVSDEPRRLSTSGVFIRESAMALLTVNRQPSTVNFPAHPLSAVR